MAELLYAKRPNPIIAAPQRRRAGVSLRREPGDPWQQAGHALAMSDVYRLQLRVRQRPRVIQQTENVGT